MRGLFSALLARFPRKHVASGLFASFLALSLVSTSTSNSLVITADAGGASASVTPLIDQREASEASVENGSKSRADSSDASPDPGPLAAHLLAEPDASTPYFIPVALFEGEEPIKTPTPRISTIDPVVLAAYQNAADRWNEFGKCNGRWSILAAIGHVESSHARSNRSGAEISPNGDVRPVIRGVPLNGIGVARIADSDGGALDGDDVYDRAMGPMQFIPQTWQRHAVDGNNDGVADPDNIFDAAVTAAAYLCRAAPGDFSKEDQLARAIFSYNHSDAYVRLVLDLADLYDGVGMGSRSLTINNGGSTSGAPITDYELPEIDLSTTTTVPDGEVPETTLPELPPIPDRTPITMPPITVPPTTSVPTSVTPPPPPTAPSTTTTTRPTTTTTLKPGGTTTTTTTSTTTTTAPPPTTTTPPPPTTTTPPPTTTTPPPVVKALVLNAASVTVVPNANWVVDISIASSTGIDVEAVLEWRATLNNAAGNGQPLASGNVTVQPGGQVALSIQGSPEQFESGATIVIKLVSLTENVVVRGSDGSEPAVVVRTIG